MFKIFAYDCILMDLQMPELDGFEATKAIQKENKYQDSEIPIIAVTARVDSDTRKTCNDLGMHDFLKKPIKFEELKNVLEKINLSSRQDISH